MRYARSIAFWLVWSAAVLFSGITLLLWLYVLGRLLG